MVSRMKYIEKNKVYDFNPIFIEGFKKLKNKSEIPLNFFLKYSLTQDKKYSHKIVSLFNGLYINEQALLGQLLNGFSENSLL